MDKRTVIEDSFKAIFRGCCEDVLVIFGNFILSVQICYSALDII